MSENIAKIMINYEKRTYFHVQLLFDYGVKLLARRKLFARVGWLNINWKEMNFAFTFVCFSYF